VVVCGRVVERVVVDVVVCRLSGWLALFGLCFLVIHQRSSQAWSEVCLGGMIFVLE
jgi:hypothetical protein